MRTSPALLILIVGAASLGCGGESPSTDEASNAAATKDPPRPAKTKDESGTAPPEMADKSDEVKAETKADDTGDSAATDDGEESPPATEGGDEPAPEPGDYRHASFVPADAPAEHREAFLALKQKKSDGAPVGGIGPHGIHLDALVIGRDYIDGECYPPANEFSLAEVNRVHLCLRVVHGGNIEEPLKVEWLREGGKPRASNLTLKNPHAYKTHAWHPIKKYSQGNFTVTVTTADGTVLGSKKFEVVE